MKIGFIGLGKMGFNMVQNMLEHNHEVIAFDISEDLTKKAVQYGAKGTSSLEELISNLTTPRIIWLMIPAGEAVDKIIQELLPLLEPNDVLIDGGNSYYKDTLRRADLLIEKGINFIDVGTSGGLEGARNGACMMIGGNKETYLKLEPLFKSMCVENGCNYVGKSGSGHFVKMVHNGIEYGMMQAIGEGFDLLNSSDFDLNLEDIAKIWANGSVIRGWLMDLTHNALSKNKNLSEIEGKIADSGEGKWTVEAALDYNVAIPVIAASMFERYRSRTANTISNKVVAALRNEFGGHGFTKS
jgi:6-phosphogluconate dehydrogenase